MDRLDILGLSDAMTTSPFLIAGTAAAVTSTAVGGLFYAFSTFVMRGLDRAQPVEAIAAMKGINTEAQGNGPFLLLFCGSAVLALVVGIIAVVQFSRPGSGYVVAGAVLAVVAFVVTMLFNVPLNNTLDALDPSVMSTGDALREWQSYLGPWTAWNHVRTVAPLIGSVLILVGLRYR